MTRTRHHSFSSGQPWTTLLQAHASVFLRCTCCLAHATSNLGTFPMEATNISSQWCKSSCSHLTRTTNTTQRCCAARASVLLSEHTRAQLNVMFLTLVLSNLHFYLPRKNPLCCEFAKCAATSVPRVPLFVCTARSRAVTHTGHRHRSAVDRSARATRSRVADRASQRILTSPTSTMSR